MASVAMLGSMLGGLHIWHWLIVLVIVFVLFAGRGSIERLTNDFARGINENARPDEIFRPAAGKLNRWLIIVAILLGIAYVVGYIVISVWS